MRMTQLGLLLHSSYQSVKLRFGFPSNLSYPPSTFILD